MWIPSPRTPLEFIKLFASLVWFAITDSFTVKRCSLCRKRYTRSEWCSLPSVGVLYSEDEKYTYRLELRNCVCRSTIGIETLRRKP